MSTWSSTSKPLTTPVTGTPPRRKLALDEEVNEKPMISKDEITQLQIDLLKQNEYEFIETATRNIIFVGKTRSGKSTAVSVLKDPTHQPSKFSIFSETVDAHFSSFSIKDNSSEGASVKKYTVNVIDTPGLFESKAIESGKERTDEEILNIVSRCLKSEITKINCVVMFASFSAGVDQNDVAAIKLFADLFGSRIECHACKEMVANPPDTKQKADLAREHFQDSHQPVPGCETCRNSVTAVAADCEHDRVDGAVYANHAKHCLDDHADRARLRLALCVTRSDNHTKEWRDDLKSQLKNHKVLGPLIEKHHIDLLFMGCVDPANGYANSDHLWSGYTSVYRMRKQMLDLIFGADYPQRIMDLSVMAPRRKQFADLVDVHKNSFEFFLQAKDLTTSEAKLRLLNHRENSTQLGQFSNYLSHSEFFEKATPLFRLARKLKERTDLTEEVKADLIWPLVLEQ